MLATATLITPDIESPLLTYSKEDGLGAIGDMVCKKSETIILIE